MFFIFIERGLLSIYLSSLHPFAIPDPDEDAGPVLPPILLHIIPLSTTALTAPVIGFSVVCRDYRMASVFCGFSLVLHLA